MACTPNGAPDAGPLPVLASSCPGWVCYAEKTHGSYILPHISSARSPQAVQGYLVKTLANPPAHQPIYHVTVMPCYDKKLEASRDDFAVQGLLHVAACRHTWCVTGVPEVDCVLTTVEVHQLLQDQGVDFASLPESPADVLLPGEDNEGGQWGFPGGAGGFMEYAMRYEWRTACACAMIAHRFAAKHALGQPLPPGPLATRALRNADMREAVVPGGDGSAHTLRCAAAYGFRNIQTTVRKVKRKACEYQFVEVMACPGGCNAGTGAFFPTLCAHTGVCAQVADSSRPLLVSRRPTCWPGWRRRTTRRCSHGTRWTTRQCMRRMQQWREGRGRQCGGRSIMFANGRWRLLSVIGNRHCVFYMVGTSSSSLILL